MLRTHVSPQMNRGSASTLASWWAFSRMYRAWLLWVAGLVILLVLAVLAHGTAQFPGDAAISGLLRPLRHSFIAPIIEFPSNVNQPTPGAILVVAIVVLLAVLRHLREALAAAIGALVSDLINALIGFILHTVVPPRGVPTTG
jgi:hypothetical protein